MFGVRGEYISYPANKDELKPIMDRYESLYLPGCGGSIDVVHVKWSNCPAGDHNRCKGKETYHSKLCLTTLAAFWAFQVFNMELAMINTL